MAEINLSAFIHRIYHISGIIHQIRNSNINLEMGTSLNTASLSTLDVISKHEQENMSAIGQMMGLTKGAISQMTSKLEQKGMIQKKKLDGNDKEIFLSITEKGQEALVEYHHLHDSFYNGMQELLNSYSEKEVSVIQSFLLETDDFLIHYKKNTQEELGVKMEGRRNND